jgi:hypothetical protein
MAALLESTDRDVVAISAARRHEHEDEDAFVARASTDLARAGVDAVWLCVPPGPHVPLLVRAALAAHLHTIVEKPWNYGADAVSALAREHRLVVAVDFEYCFLDGVRRWHDEAIAAAGDLTFGGRFAVAGGNRLGISALDNLGSHLVAIQRHAAPTAPIASLDCAYDRAPERRVWLDRGGERVAEVDFTDNDEPILQRFVDGFEDAWSSGRFPLDIEFAAGVAGAVRALG